MRYKRVTRADVAKHADVSETVVSYVLNGNRYVDGEKRKRVLQAIRELHYQPNAMARALKGKKSNHFIFIADQITNEHFSRIISEMDRYAYDMGYLISLCANRNNAEFVSQIISRQYDGIVISSISFQEEYIRNFVAAGIPVVLLVNRRYSNDLTGVGRIKTGVYQGAKECVTHLKNTGREHILYVDRYSAKGNFSTLDDLRLLGFIEQMKEEGLRVVPQSIITGCATAEEVVEEIRRILRGGLPCDAIFARNDILACLAMEAVHSLGLSVPGDIAVIGFDNSRLSQFTAPKLTTVEIQRNLIGETAVKMLHDMIEGRPVDDDVYIATKLIVREST